MIDGRNVEHDTLITLKRYYHSVGRKSGTFQRICNTVRRRLKNEAWAGNELNLYDILCPTLLKVMEF